MAIVNRGCYFKRSLSSGGRGRKISSSRWILLRASLKRFHRRQAIISRTGTQAQSAARSHHCCKPKIGTQSKANATKIIAVSIHSALLMTFISVLLHHARCDCSTKMSLLLETIFGQEFKFGSRCGKKITAARASDPAALQPPRLPSAPTRTQPISL